MSVHAVHTAGTPTASTRRLGESAVLTVTGAVEGEAAVPSGAIVEATLGAVETALGDRPRVIIADLADVRLGTFMIGLLGLIRRRTARAGVTLVLAGLSSADHDLLVRARVSPLYPTYPTVPVALGALGATRHATLARASRRDRGAAAHER